MGDHQRRFLDLLDHVRHGEGLARARHAEEDLVLVALQDALAQLLDGLRLVARGLEARCDLEFRHTGYYSIVEGVSMKREKTDLPQRAERIADILGN